MAPLPNEVVQEVRGLKFAQKITVSLPVGRGPMVNGHMTLPLQQAHVLQAAMQGLMSTKLAFNMMVSASYETRRVGEVYPFGEDEGAVEDISQRLVHIN